MTHNPTDTVELFSSCQLERELPASPQQVYSTFIEQLDRWWPAEYKFAPQDGILGIQAHVGGACFEDLEDGRRLKWGTILELQEGASIVFAWQISPKRQIINEPQNAGTVRIELTECEAGTKLKLLHEHFERYGEGWRDYMKAMNSTVGWAYCLSGLEKALR